MTVRCAYLSAGLAAATALWLGGCGRIDRALTVTSEPSGATVYLHDTEIGRTPVTVPFTWYGDYDVILRKNGCEAVKTHAEINPPWHEYPPLDFFRTLLPVTVRDHRYLHYELKELALPGDEELLNRARELRERNRRPVKF